MIKNLEFFKKSASSMNFVYKELFKFDIIIAMSNLNTIQDPKSGIQVLENLYVTSTGNDSSTFQTEEFIYSWDLFMNELEFE